MDTQPETIQFQGRMKSRTGSTYGIMSNGAWLRLDPRPYRGKSQRRQVIAQRRITRLIG